MAACGQRINERKKNCKNLQKSPKKPKNNQKKTYLGPKQHDLTRHLDLEMVEMGALWLRLVKESTKEKKTQQKSAKMTEIREITKKKTYLGPKQRVLTCYLGFKMMEVGALWLRLVKESKEKKISKNHQKSQKTKKKNTLGPNDAFWDVVWAFR